MFPWQPKKKKIASYISLGPIDQLGEFESGKVSSAEVRKDKLFNHELKKDGWGFFLEWSMYFAALIGGGAIGIVFEDPTIKTGGFPVSSAALGAVIQKQSSRDSKKDIA